MSISKDDLFIFFTKGDFSGKFFIDEYMQRLYHVIIVSLAIIK